MTISQREVTAESLNSELEALENENKFAYMIEDLGNGTIIIHYADSQEEVQEMFQPPPPTETELMQGELGHMVFRNAIDEMKITSLETTVAQLVAQSAEDKEKISFLESTVGDLVSSVGELLSIVGKLKGGIF